MPEEQASMNVEEYDEEYETYPDPDAVMPDGDHQATLVNARTVEANDQRWWVSDFQNAEGKVTKWSSFDNETSRPYIKADAIRLGYRGETFQGIVLAIENGEFDGIVCDIHVKTTPGDKRDFTNVYINRAYPDGPRGEGVSAGSGASSAGAQTDDDIPF